MSATIKFLPGHTLAVSGQGHVPTAKSTLKRKRCFVITPNYENTCKMKYNGEKIISVALIVSEI